MNCSASSNNVRTTPRSTALFSTFGIFFRWERFGMPPIVMDLAILLVFALMAYALAAEGAWGAGVMFFNSLFSMVLALNFYEPLSDLCKENAPEMFVSYCDLFMLLGIFTLSVTLLRLFSDSLNRKLPPLPDAVGLPARYLFGIGTSAIAVGMLLLGLHEAPVHKKFFGVVDYDSKPPFQMGLDVTLVNLFRHMSETSLSNFGDEGPTPFVEGEAWISARHNDRTFTVTGSTP